MSTFRKFGPLSVLIAAGFLTSACQVTTDTREASTMGVPFAGAVPGVAPSPVPSIALNGLVFSGDAAAYLTTSSASGALRGDYWQDSRGSGNGFAIGYQGNYADPRVVSTLFDGHGGLRFLAQETSSLQATSNFGVSYADGFTVLAVMTSNSAANYAMFGDGLGNALVGSAPQNRAGLGRNYVESEGLPLNVPIIYGAVHSGGAAGTLKAVLDGRTLSAGTSFASQVAWGRPFVGGSFPGGSASVDVRTLLIWNRPLSAAELADAAAALHRDLKVPALPAPAWNLVVEGNSLAAGHGGDSRWTMNDGISASSHTPGPRDWKLVAQESTTSDDLFARGDRVDALLDRTIPTERRILLVWEISNDLNAGYTAAQAYSALRSYARERTAAGWKVVIATALPRASSTPNFESNRQAVNAQIRAHAVAEGWAAAVADIGSDSTIGAAGASSNATFYVDGFHLSNAGHQIAATYVTLAINALVP